jgi:hypothetical protein
MFIARVAATKKSASIQVITSTLSVARKKESENQTRNYFTFA